MPLRAGKREGKGEERRARKRHEVNDYGKDSSICKQEAQVGRSEPAQCLVIIAEGLEA